MEIYWQQIKTFLKRKEPSLVLILNEGATNFKIEETEKQLGILLPDSIKNFYQIHNGVNQSNYVGDWQILPLEMIEEAKRNISGLRVADEALRRYTWNDSWIPFAIDTTGNLASINLVEEINETNPFVKEAVFILWREERRIEEISCDLSEWLEHLIQELE